MPYGLFRTLFFHNPAPHSDIVRLTPHFYPHFGAVHKVKFYLCASTTWNLTFEAGIINIKGELYL